MNLDFKRVYDKEGTTYPELDKTYLLLTESGDYLIGWRVQMGNGDSYFAFGCKYSSWDYEFNYNLGGGLEWAYLLEVN